MLIKWVPQYPVWRSTTVAAVAVSGVALTVVASHIVPMDYAPSKVCLLHWYYTVTSAAALQHVRSECSFSYGVAASGGMPMEVAGQA